MEKPKFTTIFSSEVRPLITEEKDKYLAMASLLDVGDFIPDIDAEKDYDLLPVAFNAFVANRVNKNGDVVSGSKAVEISNSFINKPINVEHNRDRVVGVILSAGYSEFGTDKPLSEEEVKEMDGPFNVTLGGIIWKVVNDDLAGLIEESNDPTSEFYQKISASWELGFSEYQLAVVDGHDKNLENAQIISNAEEIAEKEKDLKAFGGTGILEDGKAVYRYVVGDVLPLGIGLTENPAAEVVGVAVKKLDKSESNDNNNITEKSEENKTSQSEEIIVKKDVKIMKIESIKDINNESLKTLEASAVADFIEEELRKANEQYASEIEEKESAITELQEQQEKLSTESKETEKTLENVQAELTTLKEEKAAKEAEETFNMRMSQMDEEYELTDEDREVIATDVKDLDDENFSNYLKKMGVLLRNKNKQVLAEAKATAEAEDAEKATEVDAEATKEEVEVQQAQSEEIVDEVLEEAEADAQEIPASSEAQDETLYDKYKNAFGLDQFDINVR